MSSGKETSSKRALALGVALAVTLGLVIALTLALVFSPLLHYTQEEENDSSSCLTPECTIAAASLLENVDFAVDPCENFFQYACGGFNDRYYFPTGTNAVSQFTLAEQHNDMALINVLENTDALDSSDAFDKARKYYSQCMDGNGLERRGVDPIRELWDIAESLTEEREGDTNSTAAKKKDLVFGAIRELHARHIHSLLVSYYISESTLHVRQGRLGLPQSAYGNDTKYNILMMGYKHALYEGFRAMNDTKAPQEIESLVAFEEKIAACHAPKENLRVSILTHNRMEVEEVDALFPIGWDALIANFSGHANYSGEINVDTPSALHCMTRVLEEAPVEDISNHMKISILIQKANLLNSKMRDWKSRYHFQTMGIDTNGPRWRQCLGGVTSSKKFGFAVSKPYIEKLLSADTKAVVQEMVHTIQDTFLESLTPLEWMAESTKREANAKARAMIKHVGYPDWVMEDAKVSSFYDDVKVEDGKYFESTDSLLSSFRKRQFSLLFNDGKAEFEEWAVSPSEINAFYALVSNTLAFPVGILNPPFFTHNAPVPLNYGSLGTFVGHEFSHAFDNRGRNYDSKGALRNWWTDEDDVHYEERERCFVDQYSNYEMFGHRVNGNLTLPENIADNVGLQLAFLAFRKELATNKITRLPSTPWSPNQLFYLGFAQAWCDSMREKQAIALIGSDEHSPPEFRVNGAVSNSAGFADAFRCKLGSNMNPPHKCTLF